MLGALSRVYVLMLVPPSRNVADLAESCRLDLAPRECWRLKDLADARVGTGLVRYSRLRNSGAESVDVLRHFRP